jgi:dihydrofolate reductase
MGRRQHAQRQATNAEGDDMTKVTCELTISIDGYGAGPNQSEERPFGEDGGDGWGSKLHAWMFDNSDDNSAGGDQSEEDQSEITMDVGAVIMGRNMFGPIRGEWDRPWNGWWGDNPPFHAPVFVLTNHPREPQPMEGGTTYHFVTEGIEAAMKRAREAAGGREISIQGGASTINEYLAAGMIDEVRVHIVPLILGGGSRLFDGLPPMEWEQIESPAPPKKGVTHLTYRVPSRS